MPVWRVRDFHDDYLDQAISIWDASRERVEPVFLAAEVIATAWAGHAHREARLDFGGVLTALPVLWVNHPNRAADAMFKPLQLAAAAACGLRIQPTLVTNSLASATRFIREHGVDEVVCKSFGPNTITEGGQLKTAYTRCLTENDLVELDGVASTATQLQR
ncbi:hypothetical protein [Saccharomonospora sp.]|uniref:hypothetical protein n=1 Tax=Saccharomonospora sp. TaxID=33913 RepID=UPI0026369E12|nr:hypothetical protein [Saccharomonospora sp.]